MILTILLAVAITLQFFAAFIAIKLTRTTKYNASWILITIAVTLQGVLMLSQFTTSLERFTTIPFVFKLSNQAFVIIIVIISMCFAIGVFLIKKILNHISLIEKRRRQNDERILNAVIQAEEKERQRFAKELHDGLGPLLSSARLSVSALSSRMENQLAKDILSNIEQAVNLSVKSVKEISANLTPHILNSFGIETALNSFINSLRPAVLTKIIFDTNIKDKRFENQTELLVYRSVCELINNSLKHAHAKILIITIEYDNPYLRIEVNDDGVGFDTELQYEGMGLSNISSRIGSVKGYIDIHSDNKSGTHIIISLPVSVLNSKRSK